MITVKHKSCIIFSFILMLFLLTHFLPFFKSNDPLSYDTGLYRGRLINFANNLPKFEINVIAPNEPSLLYVLSDVLHLVGWPVDLILYGFYLYCNILVFFLLYIFLKKKLNLATAFCGIFLFSVSLTQYEAFTNIFYKNIIGFVLILLSFYLLEKKSYLLILTGAALLGFHTLSFSLFFLSLIIYGLLNIDNRKYLFYCSFFILFLGMLCYANNFSAILNYLPISLKNLFNLANLDKTEKTGSFWNISTYFFYALSYLWLTAFYWIKIIKNKKIDYLFIYFNLNLLIIILGLFFYKRFLLYFDFVAIIMAASALLSVLESINEKKQKLLIIIIFLWLFFLIVRIIIFSCSTKAQISAQELHEINSINNLPEAATILSANNQVAPWLYGFSGKTVIWPGKFKSDQWTLNQWQIFWQTTDNNVRKKLLDFLPQPLYIYIPDELVELRTQINQNSSYQQVSTHLWYYDKK